MRALCPTEACTLAAALALLVHCVPRAEPRPCHHLGERARAFLEMVTVRGVEPRVLGPNTWKRVGLEPTHDRVGFCPFEVAHHHHRTEFTCVDRSALSGCHQQFEDGAAKIHAGCVYVQAVPTVSEDE